MPLKQVIDAAAAQSDGRVTIPRPPSRVTEPDIPVAQRAQGNATSDWLNTVLGPILNRIGASAPKRQLACAADRSVIPLVYGEDRVGALILNVVTSGSNVLVQCLWALACDSINDIRYNDQALPAGAAATNYDGSQTAVDSALAAAFSAAGITYTETLNGYAYSVITIPQSSFTGSLSFTARIRGRKVYDPRSSTTAWSDNPALCLADFLTNTTYGAGKTIDYSSVASVANANDALVGGEKRRTVGIAFTSQSTAADMAEVLRAYAGCFLVPSTNGIKFIADAPGSSVATYDHDSGQIAALVSVEKKDSGNVPTVVEVVYTDTSAVPWRDASAIASTPGAGSTIPWRLSQVAMPGVHRYSQALREATERLNKLRTSDLNVTLDVFDIGIAHEVGDIITVTHPVGLSGKALRVVDCYPVREGVWRLACSEYDPAAYSDAVASGPTYTDTNLSNPAVPPSTPTGLAYSFSTSGIELQWARNPELTVAEYELRKGGSTWESATPLYGSTPTIVAGTTYTLPYQAAGTFKVWIKARTSISVESVSAHSVDVTVAAPSLLSLNTSLSGTQYVLEWTLASSPQGVKGYRVRRAGALIAEVNATKFSALVDWSGSVTFAVSAVDQYGNEGAALSSQVNISGPTGVGSFTASTVINTVVFYWTPPVSALPISSYIIKKGADYASAVQIGKKAGDQTFTTHTESQGGDFKYWIVPVDSVGNEGQPVSTVVKVSSPSNFKLVQQFSHSTFDGTKTNAVASFDGKLYAPVNTSQTFQQHFTSRGWTTPQQQQAAGFPLYIQPTEATGSYVKVFDAGASISSAMISVIVNGGWIAGTDGTMTPKIEVSSDNFAADTRNLGNVYEAFATSFRYVRVTLSWTATGGDDLYRMDSLVVNVSLQTEVDSGKKLASDFVGGVCSVSFTKPFIDVDSIQVSVNSTARREVAYEFNDVPNPTGFSVRVWDAAGNLTPTDFTWQATGVI